MSKSNPLPRLIESIRLSNGATPLLPYHQRRMDRARLALFARSPVLKLEKILGEMDLPGKGLYKIRLEYDKALRKREVIPYAIRPIKSLRIVDADGVRYGKKFADRAAIRRCLEAKGTADDVLMIQRGHVTDSSYANVALYDGSAWFTPSWPLLPGTRRAALIEKNVLRPYLIRERDLTNFEKIRLINAMIPWEEAVEVGMAQVGRK